MSTNVTLTGRLTRDPDVKFSPAGKAVARFAVVTSRRVKDRDSGEWSDADTTFWDCVAFGELAQNIADSLEKGTAVIVTGHASQEEWEKDGQKRRSMKVIAEDVAASLRWASAKVMKAGQQSADTSKPAPRDENPFDSEPPF
jgi:single-strand DNA-binding protein